MAKVVIDDVRGIDQKSVGSGAVIKNASELAGTLRLNPTSITNSGGGLTMVALGEAKSLLRTGAGNVALSCTVPANAMLVNVGIVFTTAVTLSGATNSGVIVGTTAAGSEIVAIGTLGSSTASPAPINTVLSTKGKTEAGGVMALVANAPLRFAAEQVIHFTFQNQANNVTAGVGVPFAEYIIVQ